MSRMQLALNVDDLDEAVAFYSKLFDTKPAKLKEGYANFAIAEPPMKQVASAAVAPPQRRRTNRRAPVPALIADRRATLT
jgi:predicted enzyme related to lactoylglutathione lyase